MNIKLDTPIKTTRMVRQTEEHSEVSISGIVINPNEKRLVVTVAPTGKQIELNGPDYDAAALQIEKVLLKVLSPLITAAFTQPAVAPQETATAQE